MSAEALLSELAPLRVPEPVGWWPLAPAVWVLLLLTVLLTALIAVVVVRRYRQRAYRREADAALQLLYQRWCADGKTEPYLAEVNRLLKAIALRLAPANEVAALTGAAWQCWLQGRAAELEDPDPRWVDSWYRADGTAADLNVDAMHQYFCDWVAKHA